MLKHRLDADHRKRVKKDRPASVRDRRASRV
jgi:hypothetical protein